MADWPFIALKPRCRASTDGRSSKMEAKDRVAFTISRRSAGISYGATEAEETATGSRKANCSTLWLLTSRPPHGSLDLRPPPSRNGVILKVVKGLHLFFRYSFDPTLCGNPLVRSRTNRGSNPSRRRSSTQSGQSSLRVSSPSAPSPAQSPSECTGSSRTRRGGRSYNAQ